MLTFLRELRNSARTSEGCGMNKSGEAKNSWYNQRGMCCWKIERYEID